MNNSYLLLGSTFTIATACACLAAPMIGNLNQFPMAGIGDVRTPTAGIYFGTAFKTDSSAYYTLDSIGIEQYLFAADKIVQVQLYRLDPGTALIPVAELGAPLAVPTPTPYPEFTSFVSYAPGAQVVLAPSTTYVVVVGQPKGSKVEAGVLFTASPNYAAADDWTLGADYAGMAVGDTLVWGSAWQPGHLKLQLDATYDRPANLPPDVSQARPSETALWPPNREFVPFQIEGITDPNGDSVSVTITTILQDEPVASDGLTPDAILLWDSLAMLRAERLGSGNGRVYAIVFTATDNKGGVSEGVVYVGVPHDDESTAVDDGPTSGYYFSTGAQAAPGMKTKKGKR